jgi:hypothetical protein
MIGIPLPNILDRWASHTGRCGGATAEKAVPFPSDCPLIPNSLLSRCARHSVAMASPSLPEVKRAEYHQRCASVREILQRSANLFHLVTLQSGFPALLSPSYNANQGAGMTNKFLLNDAEHWRTRAEEARLLAKETKASETKNALLRIGDNYEHLAQWVEDWALQRLPRN